MAGIRLFYENLRCQWFAKVENENCTICLESIRGKFVLGCGHKYCYQCIKRWSERFDRNAPTCPLCNRRFYMYSWLLDIIVERNNPRKILSKLMKQEWVWVVMVVGALFTGGCISNPTISLSSVVVIALVFLFWRILLPDRVLEKKTLMAASIFVSVYIQLSLINKLSLSTIVKSSSINAV